MALGRPPDGTRPDSTGVDLAENKGRTARRDDTTRPENGKSFCISYPNPIYKDAQDKEACKKQVTGMPSRDSGLRRGYMVAAGYDLAERIDARTGTCHGPSKAR